MRKQKGITLLALIVTIIIMLILAGVTINLGVGEGGIFSNAEKAVSDATIAKAKEEAELKIAKFVIDYHKELVTDKTAAEYVEEKIDNGIETSSGDFFVNMREDNYVVVYEAGTENKVTAGKMESSGGIEWMELPQISSELNIGDVVAYSPSGTYNWQAKYASYSLADDGSADVLLASGTAVTDQNQDMSIKSWSVFSIDDVTGNVQLVPNEPTAGTVNLQQWQGYNNGVKLLNDACSSLYGNVEKEISARSINIQDIEGKLTETALQNAHNYQSQGAKYGEKLANECTANKLYPVIYEQENLSVINGVENADGLGISEQTEFIERNGSQVTMAKSIQPYQTYWTMNGMNKAFKSEENADYNLLLNYNGSNGVGYWVASRCVNTFSSTLYCSFAMSIMEQYVVSYKNMYSSGGGGGQGSHHIFPIVTLNVNLISGNDTDGWKIE